MIPKQLATWFLLIVVLGFVLFAQLASASVPGDPVGRWLTATNGGVVEIDHCGNTALCGRIVGITVDRPTGPLPTDVHGRPQCGLTIITGAVPSGPSEWTGRIVNPKDGKVYSAQLLPHAYGHLQLRSYLGLPVFGRTVVWLPFDGRIADQCRVIG